jgi:hypothetical protein
VLLAKVCEGVEGVEGTKDGGACGGDHDEGSLLLSDGLDDALLQMFGVHAPSGVSLDFDDVVCANAQPVGTLQTRVVTLKNYFKLEIFQNLLFTKIFHL